MNRARGYLLVVGCLLISLVPAVHAQVYVPPPTGFEPKHLQMQRLKGTHGQSSRHAFAQRPVQQVTRRPNARAVRPVTDDDSTMDSAAMLEQPIIVDDPSVLALPEAESTFHSPAATFEPEYGVPQFDSGPCDLSCPPIFWFGADYLAWGLREADSPPLATTSVAGTPREAAGVLGEPGVSTLFGADGLHGDLRSGARFMLGGWFSPQRTSGIQVSYITLEEDEESFTGSSSEFPILARPFYNMRLFDEDARLIQFPDLVRGDLRIRSTSEFDSIEVMYLEPAAQEYGSTQLMIGYRQANLDELIRFDETTVSLVSPTLNSTFALFDEFDVDNTFHGWQIGVQHTGQLGKCWTYDLIGKAALGNTRSRLRINGQTVTTTANGDTSTSPEGLLALSTNIGAESDDKFSSVFELGINLRRCFQNGLQLRIGYSYLHWSSVLRAVEQIDRNITPSEVAPDTRVGPERPSRLLEHSGFWAQGLNAGLEYQF